MTVLPRTDVHQHLWPPELLAALERRCELPFARRDDGAWRLHVPGEPAATVAAQEGADRDGGLAAQGVDRALLSLSTALRVETLAAGEAQPLLDAWRAVVRELPSALGAWGTLNLPDARPGDVDALLDEGFVGLCLPAGALAHPRRVERLANLLDRLEARDAPLFVHPGPAAGDDDDAEPWWPALTSYTASLQAAWWAWADTGLARHPRLRVVFAALAGSLRCTASAPPPAAGRRSRSSRSCSTRRRRMARRRSRSCAGPSAPPSSCTAPTCPCSAARPRRTTRRCCGPIRRGSRMSAVAIVGRAELRDIVSGLAADPRPWAHLVRHDPAQRVFECLRLDDQLEIWLICWMPGHDTGFHDHDLSSGAVVVSQGAVVEERLRLGAPPALRRYVPGDVFDFSPVDIHRVTHSGNARPRRCMHTVRRCAAWAPTSSSRVALSSAIRWPRTKSCGR